MSWEKESLGLIWSVKIQISQWSGKVWSGTLLYVVIYWATSQHFGLIWDFAICCYTLSHFPAFGLIWDFAICCYILSHFPSFWSDLGLHYMLLYIEPPPSMIWDFAICCYILSHFPAFWSALGLCYMLLYIEPLPSILVWSGTSLYVVIYWATSQHFGLIWDFAICCYILSHFPAFWSDLWLCYVVIYWALPSILVCSLDFAICCYILSHFPAFWSALGLRYMLLYIEPLPNVLVWSGTLLYVVIYWATFQHFGLIWDFAIYCYILSHFPAFWKFIRGSLMKPYWLKVAGLAKKNLTFFHFYDLKDHSF